MTKTISCSFWTYTRPIQSQQWLNGPRREGSTFSYYLPTHPICCSP
jgi:hypothetical protein